MIPSPAEQELVDSVVLRQIAETQPNRQAVLNELVEGYRAATDKRVYLRSVQVRYLGAVAASGPRIVF